MYAKFCLRINIAYSLDDGQSNFRRHTRVQAEKEDLPSNLQFEHIFLSITSLFIINVFTYHRRIPRMTTYGEAPRLLSRLAVGG